MSLIYQLDDFVYNFLYAFPATREIKHNYVFRGHAFLFLCKRLIHCSRRASNVFRAKGGVHYSVILLYLISRVQFSENF